jgi:hypothetical protein
MVLSAAKERSVQAYAHLQHASVTEASDEIVTIGVAGKFNRDRLAEEKMAALVADAIEHASGAHPRVRFELLAGDSKPARAPLGGLALAADVLGEELL